MLALESLGRQSGTERPQVKFARNPNYGDDVRWLMKISRQLGKDRKYVHWFDKFLKLFFVYFRHQCSSGIYEQSSSHRHITFLTTGMHF